VNKSVRASSGCTDLTYHIPQETSSSTCRTPPKAEEKNISIGTARTMPLTTASELNIIAVAVGFLSRCSVTVKRIVSVHVITGPSRPAQKPSAIPVRKSGSPGTRLGFPTLLNPVLMWTPSSLAPTPWPTSCKNAEKRIAPNRATPQAKRTREDCLRKDGVTFFTTTSPSQGVSAVVSHKFRPASRVDFAPVADRMRHIRPHNLDLPDNLQKDRHEAFNNHRTSRKPEAASASFSQNSFPCFLSKKHRMALPTPKAREKWGENNIPNATPNSEAGVANSKMVSTNAPIRKLSGRRYLRLFSCLGSYAALQLSRPDLE